MPRFSNPTPSHPYLYLPDGWDTGWKAAKAASAGAPARIALIGDSTAIAAGPADTFTTSYFARIRSALSGYGIYADSYGAGLNSVNLAAGTTIPFTVSASPAADQGYGLGTVVHYSGASGGTVTFTSPNPCTDIDILYDNSVAGTWQYTLDGGTAQTVTTTAGTRGTVAAVQLRGLATTPHTIVCSAQSATNVMGIAGVTCYPNGASATSGVGFAYYPYSGTSTWQFTQGNLIAQWGGRAAGGITAFPVAPHLFIVNHGVNDFSGSLVGPAKWFHTYRTLIEAVRRSQPNAAFLFIGSNVPDPDYSDSAGTYWGTSSQQRGWPVYLRRMRELAAEYCCAFLNVHARWGELPATNGLNVSATNWHPSGVTGQGDIASALAGII